VYEGDGRREVEATRGASKDMTEHGATDHSRSTRTGPQDSQLIDPNLFGVALTR
jgi:hypothetical protein